MVNYNLEHLTQNDDQVVLGPIQDDEALFLYSMIRTMRLATILEIGGLSGYSARNFLKATENIPNSIVYTIDVNEVQPLESRHKCIIKDAKLISKRDIDRPIDLVFFDCHVYEAQMTLYNNLLKEGIITDDTIIALHDTNLHYIKTVPWAIPKDDGFIHQGVERMMVDDFKKLNYDIICMHTTKSKHDSNLPFRHGLTICKKFKNLTNKYENIKLVINSHKNSKAAQKMLYENMIELGMHKIVSIVFVVGDSEDAQDVKDGNGVRWVKTLENYIDFNGIIWAADNLESSDCILYLHDTIKFGSNRIFNYIDMTTKMLKKTPSMNMGTYVVGDLKKIKDSLKDRYDNCDTKTSKARCVNDEDIIFRTFKISSTITNKNPTISRPEDIYGTGVMRRTEYYEEIDLYKYKANWYLKSDNNYELKN